jgi:hypothetical protein
MSRLTWLIVLVVAFAGCQKSEHKHAKAPLTTTAEKPPKEVPVTEVPQPKKETTPAQTYTPPEDKELAALKDVPVDDLVGRLNDEKERALATRALATRGESAVAPLVKALDDKDPQVRAAAAYVLGQLGKDGAAAKERLKEMSTADDNEVAKDAATFALDALEGN